jgi:hypothetical protein
LIGQASLLLVEQQNQAHFSKQDRGSSGARLWPLFLKASVISLSFAKQTFREGSRSNGWE